MSACHRHASASVHLSVGVRKPLRFSSRASSQRVRAKNWPMKLTASCPARKRRRNGYEPHQFFFPSWIGRWKLFTAEPQWAGWMSLALFTFPIELTCAVASSAGAKVHRKAIQRDVTSTLGLTLELATPNFESLQQCSHGHLHPPLLRPKHLSRRPRGPEL